jgi:DNA-binding response OmpR family regulator
VVLVVEDEFLIAMDLGLLLERQGWRVLGPAASVAEALRLLEQGEEVPDAALLDVNLRGELVTPVTERLRALGIPFALASAYERVDLLAPELAGVVNVGKPTDVRRLLAALARAGVP